MQGIKLNRKCILILKNKISLSKRDFQIIIEPPEAPTEGRYSNLWNEGGQRFMRNRSSKWSLFVSWRHTTLQWLSTILSRLAFHFDLIWIHSPKQSNTKWPKFYYSWKRYKRRQILAPRLIKGQKGPLLAPILVWKLAGFLLASLAPNRGLALAGLVLRLLSVKSSGLRLLSIFSNLKNQKVKNQKQDSNCCKNCTIWSQLLLQKYLWIHQFGCRYACFFIAEAFFEPNTTKH